MIRPWWETEAGTAQKLFGDIPQVSQPGLFTDGQAGTASRGAFRSVPTTPDVSKFIYSPYNGTIPQYDNPQTATVPFLTNAQPVGPQSPQRPAQLGGFGRLPPARQMPRMSDWYRKHKGLPTSTPVRMSGWGVNGTHNFNLQPGQNLTYRRGATINAKSMATRGLSGDPSTSESGYAPKQRIGINGIRENTNVFGIGANSGRSYYNNLNGMKAAKKSGEGIKVAGKPPVQVPKTLADIRAYLQKQGYTDAQIDQQLYSGMIS